VSRVYARARHVQIYVIADYGFRDYRVIRDLSEKLAWRKEMRRMWRCVILDAYHPERISLHRDARSNPTRSRCSFRSVQHSMFTTFAALLIFALREYKKISRRTKARTEIWRNYWILRAMNARNSAQKLVNECTARWMRLLISNGLYRSRACLEKGLYAPTRDDTVR